MRAIDVGPVQPQQVHCTMHELETSSHFLEYIPGRDQLWPPPALAAGESNIVSSLVNDTVNDTGEHMPVAIGAKVASAMHE